MEIYIPGIFIGIVLVMFFYHLFLYFSTKEVNYVYYILYIFGGGLIFVTNDFHSLVAGTGVFYWILNGTIYNAFFFFWIVLFTQLFLSTKKQTPGFHVFLNILNFISVFSVFICFGDLIPIANLISSIIGIVGFITIVIVAFLCLMKGYRPARFFLVAHSFLALGTILFILTHVVPVLPITPLSFYYMKIGMTLEIIFSSFALGDRINLLKVEKALYQQEVIDQLHENEKLKDKMNAELEEKVMERTAQLETKNREITDSIHYAKRIQQSRLPSEKYIDKVLKRLKW